MDQAWVGIPDLAHRLGVSYDRARRLVLTGAVEAQRIAGHWVVSAESVEQLARQREAAAPTR